MIARAGCENRHPSHEAPARRPEKMKTYIVPNGFSIGGHSGRPERWRHDGSRWVAAEPSRYGFCVWGYDDDTPKVVRLGVNLSGREVERLADLFLAAEEVALEGRRRGSKDCFNQPPT